MKIVFFKVLESTQTYLLSHLQEDLCVVALQQSHGIGSRGNSWKAVEEGLYFSFCINLCALPKDLKIQSASIFFGFLFKEILCQKGFDVWLKWPNDLYVDSKKIGGVIVTHRGEKIVCGIGLNFISQEFGSLGVVLDRRELLEMFFEKLKNTTQWKQSFRKYKLEFYKSLETNFHDQEEILSLKNAELLDDGAIFCDGRVIYSLR